MSSAIPSSPTLHAASAASEHLDTRTAATEVAHLLHDELAGACDLCVIFASYHHRAALPEGAETIRRTVAPRVMLAVTAEAAIGGEHEYEGVAGLTAIGMRLPGVRLTPWFSKPSDPLPLNAPQVIRARLGLDDDELRAVFVAADPFTTPISRLLPAIVGAGSDGSPVPVFGGMASGASQPKCNVLVLDDRATKSGAVGVTIAGPVAVDFVLSQGCRPVGKTYVVTKAEGNELLELGGRPALAVLQDLAASLNDDERALLSSGLLVGHVIDETRRPFGRGDFLVRNLLGVNREKGAMLTGDVNRLGQTIQFHVRDARTAAEDLQLLLDAEMMREPPFGAILMGCNGRGKRLFGHEDHDLGIIRGRLGDVPTAGMFAAGEIGPVGPASFLHGHSAALALFRPPPDDAQ